VISFVSFLFYAGAHPALFIAVLYAGVVFSEERRLAWKPTAAALGGLVLGLLLHPHFPTILCLSGKAV
jgi:hypothetical protein